jgi:hypothetical protein
MLGDETVTRKFASDFDLRKHAKRLSQMGTPTKVTLKMTSNLLFLSFFLLFSYRTT